MYRCLLIDDHRQPSYDENECSQSVEQNQEFNLEVGFESSYAGSQHSVRNLATVPEFHVSDNEASSTVRRTCADQVQSELL